MLLWLNNTYIQNIRNPFLRSLIFPVIVIFISFLGFFTFQNISTFMGVYGDVDSAIQQAQVIKEDLLREEQYGGNNIILVNLMVP